MGRGSACKRLSHQLLVALACNAKSFAIAFVFLLILLLVSVFGKTGHRFLFMLLKTRVSSTRLFSLSTPKANLITYITLVVFWDACGSWRAMRFSLFMITSIHSIKKRTRNSQLTNKIEGNRRFKAQKTEKLSW